MNSFYNDVTDWLLVGGDLDLALALTGQTFTTTVAQLRERGVTHVLDVRSEWSDLDVWAAEGLSAANYHHAPIVDSHSHSPAEDWYRAVEDFVTRFWLDSAEGDRLYVHCHMGINRAPSAAMLALLTVNPEMHPYDAFLQIRGARPAAGLVYAESVGARHLAQTAEDFDGDEYALIEEGSDTYAALEQFVKVMDSYWTNEMIREVNRGIAYYRDAEGGTLTVKA